MTEQGSETAGRVSDVLMLYIDGPDVMGVTAIARELGLSKTVVHRTLSTLVAKGFLAKDPRTRTYSLGPSSASLGVRALRGSSLRIAAQPWMEKLHEITQETVTVSARVPDGRVYLAQVESASEIKMTVELGRRFPLHAGSSSMCILAFLSAAERIDYLASHPLDAVTSRTVTNQDALRARLEEVRRTGTAHSEGERQHGAGSIAAPIFGVDGQVVGALSVCGPGYRMDREARDKAVPDVVHAADEVSRSLGWIGGLPRTDPL